MLELDPSGVAPQPKTLAEAQQTIEALWAALHAALNRIEQSEERLNADSQNTFKPPSSDSSQSRAVRRRKPRSERRQGAQPGHPKHEGTVANLLCSGIMR